MPILTHPPSFVFFNNLQKHQPHQPGHKKNRNRIVFAVPALYNSATAQGNRNVPQLYRSAPQRSFCQFQPKLTGRDIFTNHIFSNFYFIRLFYFLSDCFCRKDKSFSLNRHHLRGKILMTDDFLTRCTPATELTSLSGRTGGARYLLHNDLLSSVDINSRSSRLLRKLYAVDSVPRSRIISIGSLDIVYFG